MDSMDPQEPNRPSLLIHTDGQPFDEERLRRLVGEFQVMVYFHSPFDADEEAYQAKQAALVLLCDRFKTTLIEDPLVGKAWEDHVSTAEAPETTMIFPAHFAVIEHVASYAQTEGFDFFTPLQPDARAFRPCEKHGF